MRYHWSVFTFQGHTAVHVILLAFQYQEMNLGYIPFKQAPEISRYESPMNICKQQNIHAVKIWPLAKLLKLI